MLEYGRKIRILLAQLGKSQKSLADFAGVTPTTVSDSWIKKSLQPQERNAQKIEQYFDGGINMEDMGY